MKYSRKLILTPLALCLLPLLHGCGGSSPATGISAGAMSLTQGDTTGTSTFKTTDTPLYANVDLNGVGNGAKLKFVWTMVDAGDNKNEKFAEIEIPTEGKMNAAHSDFKVSAPGGLPKGSYKTEVFFNDKLDKTLDWTVK